MTLNEVKNLVKYKGIVKGYMDDIAKYIYCNDNDYLTEDDKAEMTRMLHCVAAIAEGHYFAELDENKIADFKAMFPEG